MKRLPAVALAALLFGGAGGIAVATPAGAIGQKLAAERQIKAKLSKPQPKGFDVPHVNSVRCVGAAVFTGKSGSKFTCYAYNKLGEELGQVNGTNLGGGTANLEWAPS
jgi:hypothetical protein